MLGLAVLGALAFSAWRVVDELRLLNRSLAKLRARIAPTLEQIARDGEAAAERAARMQARAGQGPAGQGPAGRRPERAERRDPGGQAP